MAQCLAQLQSVPFAQLMPLARAAIVKQLVRTAYDFKSASVPIRRPGPGPDTIDAYIDGFPPSVQAILQSVRQTVRSAAPQAEETISYRIPAFKQRGVLVYFAAFNHHIGFYPPVSGDPALEAAAAPYAGEKGNLRFPLEEPMPLALIARITRLRVAQNAAIDQEGKSTEDRALRYVLDEGEEIDEGLEIVQRQLKSRTVRAGEEELFKAKAGVDMVHVPYKGGPDAIQAVLKGDVCCIFNQVQTVLQHAKAGTVRLLGVTTKKRVAAIPDVPTIDEAGVAGYESYTWFAIFGPKGLDRAIAEKMNLAIKTALGDPETQKKLAELGNTPRYETLDQFKATVKADRAKWADVVKQVGAKVD